MDGVRRARNILTMVSRSRVLRSSANISAGKIGEKDPIRPCKNHPPSVFTNAFRHVAGCKGVPTAKVPQLCVPLHRIKVCSNNQQPMKFPLLFVDSLFFIEFMYIVFVVGSLDALSPFFNISLLSIRCNING